MRALSILAVLAALSVVSCETVPRIDQQRRAAMLAAIPNEPPGDYFIGRRYYKSDYKVWGYIREPRQMWTEARLVMMNENVRFAPDRQQGRIGMDNGYEYKLYGEFSGDRVYEPASNRFYPEFVLHDYELVSSDPPPIFQTADALIPSRRVLAQPY